MWNKQHHEPYVLDEYALREAWKMRDLGVMIASNLKSRDQMSIDTSNKVLGIIHQTFEYIDKKNFWFCKKHMFVQTWTTAFKLASPISMVIYTEFSAFKKELQNCYLHWEIWVTKKDWQGLGWLPCRKEEKGVTWLKFSRS